MLQEEIHHQKSDTKDLRKKCNSSHAFVQHEISFIDIQAAHISSIFQRSNNGVLASKSATQEEK